VLVVEPEGEYLTHVSPTSGKIVAIAHCLMAVVQELEIDTDLVVIGCDSTNINTGASGGAIHHLENMLGHSLQWFICMLHTNELPLRHLFMKLDDQTTGSTTFSGDIGKAIQTCEDRAIANFKPITDGQALPQMSNDVLEDLSRDQQYLYKIIQAIRLGTVSIDLSRQKPGLLCHSDG